MSQYYWESAAVWANSSIGRRSREGVYQSRQEWSGDRDNDETRKTRARLAEKMRKLSGVSDVAEDHASSP